MRPAGWRAGPAPFKGSLPSAQQFTAVPASKDRSGFCYEGHLPRCTAAAVGIGAMKVAFGAVLG